MNSHWRYATTKFVTFCVIIYSLQMADSMEAGNGGSVFAGWSEVEITPPLGIALGGRGSPATLATKIIDPLYGQVLYLKDANGTGLVLVSLDLIGLPHSLSERIRKSIVYELGVDYNLVLLNCSHTHSGPYMGRETTAGVGPPPQIEMEYSEELLRKITLAARESGRMLCPVKAEVFTGKSQVGINRRGKNKQGKRGIIPDPTGPIAEEVWGMKLTPANGEAPALIFSYGCHPVITYGFAYDGVSADFPGAARNTLRVRLGPKTHLQFLQGLAGNVRPRVLADLPNNRFRPSKPEDVQKAGADLANDVLAAVMGKTEPVQFNIAGASDRPFLPRDKPPAREIYERMAKEKTQYRRDVAAYWLARYDAGQGFAKGDPWPVGLVRLGENHWICYLAGEPCVEWGPLLRRWLAPRNVVCIGYTQETVAYLPTEALLPEGGYEVEESNYARANSPAKFAPGIEESIRKSLLRQVAFIEAKVQ